ncbi:MAG: 50S ribosomal protein L10 [Anaerolineales bacterium]|nr:50S ribosomal protein L10 [Anaerolineales bacterium]
MALSRNKKEKVLNQYAKWIQEARAIVVTEYTGLTMPAIDQLRAKVREVGGEFHVVKNTLGKNAFESAGLNAPDDYFVNSTAIGVAFEDAPGLAKAIIDFAKDSEFVQVKGGFLGTDLMNSNQVKIMAELPPLPVVRAQLLGTIMAPASKLVRTLAEPGRQIAQVVKAYADQGA